MFGLKSGTGGLRQDIVSPSGDISVLPPGSLLSFVKQLRDGESLVVTPRVLGTVTALAFTVQVKAGSSVANHEYLLSPLHESERVCSLYVVLMNMLRACREMTGVVITEVYQQP